MAHVVTPTAWWRWWSPPPGHAGSSSPTGPAGPAARAGCWRTSTWPGPSCPARSRGSCAASWPTDWPLSARCWWRRCSTLVGDRRVVLTPSGVLAGVPWTLLPGLVGRPVTVAQSATSWLARRTRRCGPGRRGSSPDPGWRAPSRRWPRPPWQWPGAAVLLGARRDRRGGLGAGRLGGRAARRRPRPALRGEPDVLRSPARRRPVVRLRHRPAPARCRTWCCSRPARSAAPRCAGGEELIGMTAAWLHAGARCVVASAAAVNDVAAYDVLVAVHRPLAGRRRPRRGARRERCRASPPTPPRSARLLRLTSGSFRQGGVLPPERRTTRGSGGAARAPSSATDRGVSHEHQHAAPRPA